MLMGGRSPPLGPESLAQRPGFLQVGGVEFQMGRALDGALASLLPVAHSLDIETRFGVVVGQQFGLRHDGVGKLRL